MSSAENFTKSAKRWTKAPILVLSLALCFEEVLKVLCDFTAADVPCNRLKQFSMEV